MGIPRRTVLQSGVGDPCDLFVYAHIDPSIIKAKVAETTTDMAVVEFWGLGTSAYKPVVPAYGGNWRSYVKGLEQKLSKSIGKSCLTTWSAGSQVAKDVCASNGPWPDAIVMLDGLYGAKPAGSKPGDGKVVMDDALKAVANYALRAARGECVMVLFHSAIYTTYASSKECCDAVKAYVEKEMGRAMEPDAELHPEDLDNHGFTEAYKLGNLHFVAFKGVDAKEHITEGHLYDEVWKLWIPWVRSDDPLPVIEGEDLPTLALQLSLAEEAARVGETPPGSNKVKAEYWAGCTRLIGGNEVLLKMSVGPWCACAFQWATYEAARQLGLMREHPNLSWLDGPIPHGRRVSVSEIQHDMTQRGLFKSKASVLAKEYDPRPGDAVFMDRAGAVSHSDFGHICRFVRRINASTFETVGGNEAPGANNTSDAGDRWRRTVRRYDDPRLRGFGAFPREAVTGTPLTAADVEELDALVYAGLDKMIRAYLDRPQSDGG